MRTKANGRKRSKGSDTGKLLFLFGVLLLVCLLLLASTVGGKFGPFHQLTMEVLGPVQSLFTKSVQTVQHINDDYVALWGVRDDNKRLRQTLERYQQQIDEYREAYSTSLLLQKSLDFKERESFPAISARVVGKDPAYWFQTITVDRGEKDGVVEGMVARNPDGVVGQVLHVSQNYSKIILANAPSSAIDAMVQKNRERGILRGAGENGYILHYVLKNADVAVGDHIVTAGIGGVFQAGIPLGVVSMVRKKKRGMFLEVEVQPLVDFQKLEMVFINLSEKQKVDEDPGSLNGP